MHVDVAIHYVLSKIGLYNRKVALIDIFTLSSFIGKILLNKTNKRGTVEIDHYQESKSTTEQIWIFAKICMRTFFLCILLACAFTATTTGQVEAVQGLISRVLGDVGYFTSFV